jgi:hypothetical protein
MWIAVTAYAVAVIIVSPIIVTGLIALFQLLAPEWTFKRSATGLLGEVFDADPEAKLRGRLIIVGALLTTPFLLWKVIVSHLAALAAREQARIALETARNSLFTNAIEHLGAMRETTRIVRSSPSNPLTANEPPSLHKETHTVSNTEVRLGAIYALEKLARDDLEMHWPIMETLCAYVRENAGPPQPPDEAICSIWGKGGHQTTAERETLTAYHKSLRAPPSDVQAALSVIGRRSKGQREHERARRSDSKAKSRDAWRLDLTDCHLAKVNLAGLDLTAARLDRSALMFANFDNACLVGVSFLDAHLEGASLNQTELSEARLDNAHLECAWMGEAQLQRASFKKAYLGSAGMDHAKIDDADLETAHSLTRGQLELTWGNAETKLPTSVSRPTNPRWVSAKAKADARIEFA